jgi:3-oxoacyl-[acyl-carrier protein] reductase
MMAPYWGCIAAGQTMRERDGGTIVNISSGGGAKPLPGITVYGMTKAAVNSLTWTAAAEFGPFNIRVNATAPGLDRNADGPRPIPRRDRRDKSRARRAGSPLGILGELSDIAFALLYLASDASRFVTGQVLAVNGGDSM